jgi:hypothetical protein
MKIRSQLNYLSFLFMLLFYLTSLSQTTFAQTTGTDARFEGVLKYQEGVSICQQERFLLLDCQGNLVMRLVESSGGPDLDALIGQYITVSGSDVGVECTIIAVDNVTVSESSPCNVTASFEGLLALQEGPSICMQGRFELRDCTGNIIVRLTESENGPDLDPLLGQYVRISGRDVGVECRVIQPGEVTLLNNQCSTPQPETGNPREGFLQINASGGYELRDCSGNLKMSLEVSRNQDLSSFIGQYVRVKGKKIKRTDQLKVRSITVKTSPCPR